MTEYERRELEHKRARFWFDCIFCGKPYHYERCEEASSER